MRGFVLFLGMGLFFSLVRYDGSEDLFRITASLVFSRLVSSRVFFVIFYDGYWVFDLWSKYVRFKNSC